MGSSQGNPPSKTAPRPTFDRDLSRIYTFVEQMPQLTSGGGLAALNEALIRHMSRIIGASTQSPSGKITISFIIGPRGGIFEKKIVQGTDPSVDAAALAALDKLPRIVPGKQNDQQVAVRLTLLVRLESRQ